MLAPVGVPGLREADPLAAEHSLGLSTQFWYHRAVLSDRIVESIGWSGRVGFFGAKHGHSRVGRRPCAAIRVASRLAIGFGWVRSRNRCAISRFHRSVVDGATFATARVRSCRLTRRSEPVRRPPSRGPASLESRAFRPSGQGRRHRGSPLARPRSRKRPTIGVRTPHRRAGTRAACAVPCLRPT